VIAHAAIPMGIFPPVAISTFCALKNTPEPITVPTTMQIAVSRPYFLVSFSINLLLNIEFLQRKLSD
jgi:hypothetical protein